MCDRGAAQRPDPVPPDDAARLARLERRYGDERLGPVGPGSGIDDWRFLLSLVARLRARAEAAERKSGEYQRYTDVLRRHLDAARADAREWREQATLSEHSLMIALRRCRKVEDERDGLRAALAAEPAAGGEG